MLEVVFKDIVFKNPVLTAAGTFGKGYELEDSFDLSKLGGIIPKTVTLNKRAGNPFPRLKETPCGLINSIGLENGGVVEFVEEVYPRLKNLPTELIVSISGESEEEYIKVLDKLLEKTDARVFEINLSCPNVDRGGEEFSEDIGIMSRLLESLRKLTNKMLWAKLPPDVYRIKDLVKGVIESGIDGVVLCNTYRATYIDVNNMSFSLPRGHGGLSGPAILPITLYIVKEVKASFKDFPVIASGGVFSADDVIRYILAGAHLVEVGTMNFVKPAQVFKIADKVEDYLKKKDMTLDELRGVLIK